MIKGKSDPVDARRIREYGERFLDKLEFKEYDSEEIVELKSLYSLRSQLVKARKGLRTGVHGRSNLPLQSISVNKHVRQALHNIDVEITEVENEIEVTIKANEELNENYKLINKAKRSDKKVGYDPGDWILGLSHNRYFPFDEINSVRSPYFEDIFHRRNRKNKIELSVTIYNEETKEELEIRFQIDSSRQNYKIALLNYNDFLQN